MNDKLVKIQSELKAPKGQTNSFGKYKYRSCEDILEAVKPLLAEQNMIILLSDEVVNIGTHNYVKATATVKASNDNTDGISVSAYAREAETKKGMDDAQITGAASSYARKYALNGLFAIDDTKDADSHDNRTEAPEPVVKPVQDPLAVAKNNLQKTLKSSGHDNVVRMKIAIDKVLGKSSVDTIEEANEVMQALEDGII